MKPGAPDVFLPEQPMLVVTQGNTSRRYRPLDNDVIVLGRAPGCDIGLDADDVSALHCVILRTPAGFRIRNYTRRGGTRLNGVAVQEALLHDGDLLQVSAFCFRVHLPETAAALGYTTISKKRLHRLEQSRRNLAHLALARRRRLDEARAASAAGPAAGEADVGAARPVLLAEIFPEETRQLEVRRQELDQYADRLREAQQRLDRELKELRQVRAQCDSETAVLARYQADTLRAEASVREQGQEVARMMVELRHTFQAFLSRRPPLCGTIASPALSAPGH
jgi:hypothetical protein